MCPYRCEAKLAKHAEDLAKGVPPNNYDGKLAWCKDFLVADEQGVNPGGSCCFRDEQRAAWCEQIHKPVPRISLRPCANTHMPVHVRKNERCVMHPGWEVLPLQSTVGTNNGLSTDGAQTMASAQMVHKERPQLRWCTIRGLS
eukprot:605349-Pelagomonas_calceolata.AAC.8